MAPQQPGELRPHEAAQHGLAQASIIVIRLEAMNGQPGSSDFSADVSHNQDLVSSGRHC